MFKNREEAGFKLARKLSKLGGLRPVGPTARRADVLVLGIPRGGVVTAKAVAEKIQAPLDVIVTRKIGAPNQPELAIGAVGPNGTVILDDKLIKEIGVKREYLNREIRAQRLEVSRRMKRFRAGKSPLRLRLFTVVLVDDGVATGATVEAALRYLTLRRVQGGGPKKIILAVPVAPEDTARRLGNLADKTVVLETPFDFRAVGQFYQDFPQVTDEEVGKLLRGVV